MQLNHNITNYSIFCNNDTILPKERNGLKKANSLKTELQEPKEEIMHLLSPNKSIIKFQEDDIYKTDMNNKKPIDIYQDTTIDKQEKKEVKYKDIQYLIDRNKIEKIDFITTLLKLKGIKTEEDNITNHNIDGGQSNISTTSNIEFLS